MAETDGSPAAGTEVCHISADRNEIPADAGITVYDGSCMGPAGAVDYAVVHLAAVDCNSVAGYAPRPAGMAVTVADYRTKGHANVARPPATIN